MNPISILLVDDHKLIRESWAFILNNDIRFSVIGETCSAEEAISIAKLKTPGIVLMDINMLPVDGFEATKSIRACSPLTQIIGVSMHNAPGYVKFLFKCGAKGYVTKNSAKEEMFDAIERVSKGHTYICNEIKNKISYQLIKDENDGEPTINKLTKREMEIIKLIRNGLSSKEIADQFGLSCRTVEVHRYNIQKKLNLKNTASLVNFVNINGL